MSAVRCGPAQIGRDGQGAVVANDLNHAGMKLCGWLRRRPHWHRGSPGVRPCRLRAGGWPCRGGKRAAVAGGRPDLAVAGRSRSRLSPDMSMPQPPRSGMGAPLCGDGWLWPCAARSLSEACQNVDEPIPLEIEIQQKGGFAGSRKRQKGARKLVSLQQRPNRSCQKVMAPQPVGRATKGYRPQPRS